MPNLTLREKHKRQTQIDITKAAMALFAERGFENVPVESICEQAGISRATFFNYFPQKDMILDAVGSSRIEAMRSLLDDQLGRRHKVKLRHVIALFQAFCEENEDMGLGGRGLLLQVLMRSISRAPHIELRKQFTAALAQVLEQVRSNGTLEGDPKVVAETMFSLYMGTTFEWLMDSALGPGWLTKTIKARLQVAADGFAAGKKR
jgi:AcrR family transcriptional regulator